MPAPTIPAPTEADLEVPLSFHLGQLLAAEDSGGWSDAPEASLSPRVVLAAHRRAIAAEGFLASLGKRAADILEADTGSRPVYEDHRAISSVLAIFASILKAKRREALKDLAAHDQEMGLLDA